MRGTPLLLLLVAVVVTGGMAEDDIAELTKDDFDERTKDGLWLVKFYGPKCGHCKQMAHNYMEFHKQVGEKAHRVQVAQLDAYNHRISGRFGVNGWPGFVLLHNGKHVATMERPLNRRLTGKDGVDKLWGWVQEKDPTQAKMEL